MRGGNAEAVFAVLTYGTRLRRRLRRGVPASFAREREVLKQLVLAADPVSALPHTDVETPARPAAKADRFLGITYPLTCWLDETFTHDTPWADLWNERKLEVELFGSNDRAWKFWEQAGRAEELPDADPLEVFFWCVQLGFRGTLAEDPDRLQGWLTNVAQRIGRLGGEESPYDLEPDPVPNVPPRTGEARFERMLLTAGVVILALIPVVSFLFVYHLGSR